MGVFVVLLSVLAVSLSLPYHDQMCLANSLIVGRDDLADLYSWTCKVCDQSNKPIHSHAVEEKSVDIKSIVSVYKDFIVLAFRYTNTALNVWEDILYPLQIKHPQTCSNCKVQKAYYNMWLTVKAKLIGDLTDIKKQTGIKILYITGISMGGGLTVISYVDIVKTGLFDSIKVITFGAPRVGNKYWAAHFDTLTLGLTKRYIIKGDPIVVLPRCLTLLCTYRQTGIQIVCYQDQGYCKQQAYIPDDDDQIMFNYFFRKNKVDSDIRNLKGLDSHINGYPKTYNYTLILGLDNQK